MESDIIIIGSGHAGGMTAISLRQKKYSGSILMIGKENYLPYQRPPLSKLFLYENINKERIYLKSEEYYKKNQIQILKNKKVTLINKDEKFIILDNEDKYFYKKLIIATGSQVNRLNHNCKDSNIHYLRDIDDSLEIRESLKNRKTLAIIGAGYIGMEIASAAIKNKIKPIVIEAENRSMARAVCKETSLFFERKHQKEGVHFKFNTSVETIIDAQNQKIITCNDGSEIIVDSIVIGIGIKPNIELAEKSNLDINNGIVVDEYGQTSDKNIFSVGDCTNHPNKLYKTRLRLESVNNAVEQARIVASNLVGNPKPYNVVPWFWSDQYNIKLQIVGIHDNHDYHVIEGDMDLEKFAVYYFSNRQLICVEAINNQEAFSKGKKAIRQEAKIPIELMKAKKLNIKEWLNSY